MNIPTIPGGAGGTTPSRHQVNGSPRGSSQVSTEVLPDQRANRSEPKPLPEQRLEKATERTMGRLDQAVEARSLSPRQQQALSEVQKNFESAMERLQQASFEGDGVSREKISKALDGIYGNLLNALHDILGAGKSEGPKTTGHGHTDASGLAVDTHA